MLGGDQSLPLSSTLLPVTHTQISQALFPVIDFRSISFLAGRPAHALAPLSCMAREKSWTQNINRFLTLFSIQPSMHSTTMIITFLRFFNMCSSSQPLCSTGNQFRNNCNSFYYQIHRWAGLSPHTNRKKKRITIKRMLQIETHPQRERERVGCSFFFPDISIPIEREREKKTRRGCGVD